MRPITLTRTYSPFKPVCYHNTSGSFNMGASVEVIAPHVYFVHSWDYSAVPRTFCDIDTGEEWQEYAPLSQDEYEIVYTQKDSRPADRLLSVREDALYRLAEVIRQKTGKDLTQAWEIKVVDVLPEIIHKDVSTPAGTSNVKMWGEEILPSVRILATDGWTGNIDSFWRAVYVLRSEWPELVLG